MLEFSKKQIIQNYKIKMEILLKVIMITILSSLFALLFFDFDESKSQLDLSSNINCVDFTESHKSLICNTCFKVTPQNKYKQKIQFRSANPFMLIGLKQNNKGHLFCQQWLQAIDYESQINRFSIQKTPIKIQPFVLQQLKIHQNEHNQNLLIQKSQLQQQKHILISNFSYLNFAAFYYSSSKDYKPIQIFYSNQNNKEVGMHMVRILIVSTIIAMVYMLHCYEKKRTYGDNLMSLLGIFGLFIWNFVGSFQDQQQFVILFCKVIFFSLTMGATFKKGQWLFLAINTLVLFLIYQLSQGNILYQLLFESFLLIIIVFKIYDLSNDQYFYFKKDTNKKLYLAIVTVFIITCQSIRVMIETQSFKQISSFLIIYLCIMSFLMSMKNMDIQDYSKLFKKQTDPTQMKEITEQSLQAPSTTSMAEQIQSMEQKSPRK